MSSIVNSTVDLTDVFVRYNPDHTRRRQLGQLVFYHTFAQRMMKSLPEEMATNPLPGDLLRNRKQDWQDTWRLSSAFYNAVEDSLTKYSSLNEMLVDFPYLSTPSVKDALEGYWARVGKTDHPVSSEGGATSVWALWSAAHDGLQSLIGADGLGAHVAVATYRRVEEAKKRAIAASWNADVALVGSLPKEFEIDPTGLKSWKEDFDTGMFVSFVMRAKEKHQGDGPLTWSSSDSDNFGKLYLFSLHQFCLNTIVNSFDWFMHLEAADRDPNSKEGYTDDGQQSLTGAISAIQKLVEGLDNPLAKADCKEVLDLIQDAVEARKIRSSSDEEEDE